MSFFVFSYLNHLLKFLFEYFKFKLEDRGDSGRRGPSNVDVCFNCGRSGHWYCIFIRKLNSEEYLTSTPIIK